MMLGNAGYLYIYYVFATWLPGYLVLQRHLSILNSGFVGTLPFIVGFFVTILGGWVCDMLIARGVRVTIVRKSVSVSGSWRRRSSPFSGIRHGHVRRGGVLDAGCCRFQLFDSRASSDLRVDIAPPKLVGSLSALQNSAATSADRLRRSSPASS